MTTVELGDAERARRLLHVVFEYVGGTGSRTLDECEELVKEVTDQLDELYPQFTPCPVCGAIGGDACIPQWSYGETDGVWHAGRVDVEATNNHEFIPPLNIDCPVCWAGPGEACIRGAVGYAIWDQALPLGRNHDKRIQAYRERVRSDG